MLAASTLALILLIVERELFTVQDDGNQTCWRTDPAGHGGGSRSCAMMVTGTDGIQVHSAFASVSESGPLCARVHTGT